MAAPWLARIDRELPGDVPWQRMHDVSPTQVGLGLGLVELLVGDVVGDGVERSQVGGVRDLGLAPQVEADVAHAQHLEIFARHSRPEITAGYAQAIDRGLRAVVTAIDYD